MRWERSTLPLSGGGWRGLQALDIAGEGADGPLLNRGEELWPAAGEPIVVLPQALLGGQRGFQSTSNCRTTKRFSGSASR